MKEGKKNKHLCCGFCFFFKENERGKEMNIRKRLLLKGLILTLSTYKIPSCISESPVLKEVPDPCACNLYFQSFSKQIFCFVKSS